MVGEQPVPRAISLNGTCCTCPSWPSPSPVGAVGLRAYARHDSHAYGFDGTVNDWTEKTPLILWMPVLIQGFMAACFVFSHWTIARSKKWAEPGAPATSALAYGLFARAQSIYLVAGGVVIAVAMIAMPLSFMNVIDLGQAAVFIMIAAIVLCVGAWRSASCTARRVHACSRTCRHPIGCMWTRPLLEVRRVLLQPRRCQPVPARAFRRRLDAELGRALLCGPSSQAVSW